MGKHPLSGGERGKIQWRRSERWCLRWAVPTYSRRGEAKCPGETAKGCPGPLSEEWSRPGIPGFAHGLKLDDHRIAQGHHGHGDDHSPQKSCAVMNGGRVVDEERANCGAKSSKVTRQSRAKARERVQPVGRRPGAFPAVRRHSGRPAGEADHWRRRWKNTGEADPAF